MIYYPITLSLRCFDWIRKRNLSRCLPFRVLIYDNRIFHFFRFANSFTALQFINRFNAACPPDWIMIGSSKKRAEIRGRRCGAKEENYFFPNIYFQLVLGAINQRKWFHLISFLLSRTSGEWIITCWSPMSSSRSQKNESDSEESERAASMLFMFAQCTFSKHNFMLSRKTEESFILIPSCTNTSARLKQGSEWWNNGKENCEKLDQKGTRESRKTFAQNNHRRGSGDVRHMQHAMCCEGSTRTQH